MHFRTLSQVSHRNLTQCDRGWMFVKFQLPKGKISQNLNQSCSLIFGSIWVNFWLRIHLEDCQSSEFGLTLKCDEFMNKKWNYSDGTLLYLRALELWFPLGVRHDCIWCHNQTKLEKKEIIWVLCMYPCISSRLFKLTPAL